MVPQCVQTELQNCNLMSFRSMVLRLSEVWPLAFRPEGTPMPLQSRVKIWRSMRGREGGNGAGRSVGRANESGRQGKREGQGETGWGTPMRGKSGKPGRPIKVVARRGASTEHVREMRSARKSSSFSRCERTSAPRAFGTKHMAFKCAIQQTKTLRPPMICIPWAIPPWDL